MKLFKYISLCVAAAAGVFCTMLHTSSCTKNTCGIRHRLTQILRRHRQLSQTDVTDNCQTIFRQQYANTYLGNAVYSSSVLDSTFVSHIDTNSTLIFSVGNDTMYTKMQVAWNRSSGRTVNFTITLANSSSAGSTFTTSSVTIDTFTYSGSGTVNSNVASMNIQEAHPNSHSVTISLNNFVRHLLFTGRRCCVGSWCGSIVCRFFRLFQKFLALGWRFVSL